MIITTIFETLLVIAVIWGVFNEDKLIAFEKLIASNFRRRRLRIIKSNSNYCSDKAYIFNDN